MDRLLTVAPAAAFALLLAAVPSGAWETNVAGLGVWSRAEGAARFAPASGVRRDGVELARIEHTGDADWALKPEIDIPARPGDLVEAEAYLRTTGEGSAQLSFVLRDAAGDVLDWSAGARPIEGVFTGGAVRARLIVPDKAARVSARLIGYGPLTVLAGPIAARNRGPAGASPAASNGDAAVSNAAIVVALDRATGALTLTDRRSGRMWTQHAPEAGRLRPRHVRAGARVLAYELADVLDDRAWSVEIALETNAPEAALTIRGEGPITAPLAYPFPWAPPAGAELIVPMNEGIAFPVDDPAAPTFRLVAYGGHGICMAFYGVADGEAGVMAILETADDAAVRIARRSGRLGIGPEWDPQRGAFGYARRLRLVALDRGGYVAMCKRYRAYVQQAGGLKTFDEKRKERPKVGLLAGAVNVWYMDRDKGAMGRELAEAGIRRVLWSSGGSAAELAELNRLGFLTGRYDIYQDCMDPAQFPRLSNRHGDWTSEAWPTGLVRRAGGDWERGWQVRAKDGTMIPCGVLCDRLAPDWARRRIPDDLAAKPYTARFIDTTTASPWRECYDPAHPMTRTDSRRFKMQLLDVVSRELRLVCGSETGHDAAVPYVDYFEGMLSLGPFRVPDAGRDMMRKLDEVPERVARFQTGFGYRLPLWELVYHDCVVAQWYWGDYNNKLPALWNRRDLWNALYGTPPMFMFNRAEWQRDRGRFVRSYETATPVAARTMVHEMTGHRRLAPDGSVQESRFADGTVVTVNFGDRPFTMPGGRTLGAGAADMPPAPAR